MPEYTYHDEAGHIRTEYHPAGTHPNITCPECGAQMVRLYTAPRVNWNGLRPSQGEYSDTFKRFYKTTEQRREAFARRHAQHEQDGVTKYPDREV